MKLILLCIFAGFCSIVVAADSATPPYTNNFTKDEVGKTPDDLMVLDGTFTVQEFGGVKCLELAADPIGSFGVLFGPDNMIGTDVKARIWAASTGKRFPEVGIGSNEAGGYKLFLVPARRSIELRKGDDPIASAPFDWTSGNWTWLRLHVEPKDGKNWLIQGKAWSPAQKEPQGWLVSAQESEAPAAGKASIWGSDFSEQPIRYTDLSVAAVK
jgi:hypothetical protein